MGFQKKHEMRKMAHGDLMKDQGKPRNPQWMKGAVKKPGALHKALHVPMDKKIPAAKLTKASHSKNPLMRKRANLAKTFAKFRPHG